MWRALALLILSGAATAETVADIETSMGTMTMRFFDAEAPQTVAHFKALVNEQWYDGKSFYRVVRGHVIQAGSGDDDDKATKQRTVKAEFNRHPHVRSAVGLARDDDPDSGSTEIYICDAARPHLDGRYTVFGELIAGDDVLEAIATTPVTEEWLGEKKNIAFHKPKTPVIIKRIRLRELP